MGRICHNAGASGCRNQDSIYCGFCKVSFKGRLGGLFLSTLIATNDNKYMYKIINMNNTLWFEYWDHLRSFEVDVMPSGILGPIVDVGSWQAMPGGPLVYARDRGSWILHGLEELHWTRCQGGALGSCVSGIVPLNKKNNGEPVGATDRVFQKIGNWLLGTRVIYDWYNLCLERLLRFQWDTPRTSPFTNCCPISSLLSLFVSRFTSV